MDFFISPTPFNAFVIMAPTSRHARTARTRWERVAFLKAPKSGARRDHSVVSAGVLGSVSVNRKNWAM
jgi:hypothetical protein